MASAKVRELEDNLIFKQMTTAAADKTAVDFLSKPDRMTSKDVHNMLMVAGFTPGLGNIADAADAILYAAEGEFGDAAWSTAAMIPFVGQMVSGKKALKIAKESGEEMVTLYRGVPDWYQRKMVKNRHFVSPEETKGYIPGVGMARGTNLGEGVWATSSKMLAEGYASPGFNETMLESGKMLLKARYSMQTGKKMKPAVLKFEVPKSWLDIKVAEWNRNVNKLNKKGFNYEKGMDDMYISKGIPVEFLTKVTKF